MAQPITALNPSILGFMAAICVQLSSMQYFEKNSCFTCYNATGINNSSVNQWIFINGLNTQINGKLLELFSYNTLSTRFWTRTFLPFSLLIGVSPIALVKREPMIQEWLTIIDLLIWVL